MAMSVGGGEGKTVPYINMTPLIDVLLVLLIIFMVITPITPKGLEALVPQPNEDQQNQQQQPNARTVVVSVNANRSIMINRDTTSLARLRESARHLQDARRAGDVRARGSRARLSGRRQGHRHRKGAGVDKIGLLTEEIE